MKSLDHDRWARLRFAIIGPLLAAPPRRGELRRALRDLAARSWQHPVDATALTLSVATLERWYYAARRADDPVARLRRLPRADSGRFRALSAAWIEALHAQHRAHPGWTVQLHYDNLVALADERPQLLPAPSYPTVRRYMRMRDLRRARPVRNTPGGIAASERRAQFETRSFETEYVHSLWHADFHVGSRRVVTGSGQWRTAYLLCFLDDHARIVCHLQWYLEETAESVVHALCQALLKHGLPRALLTDNGAPFLAEEVREGLHRLGILQETTLPYSPQQNAKQENFWANLEGRLMAMLDGVEGLTLKRLNEFTQAWVEQAYHRDDHRELGTSPMRRFLDATDVGRPAPDHSTLVAAFRRRGVRRQRRSDGTVSLGWQRFEIPAAWRTLEKVHLAWASWDLRSVDLVDPRTGNVLAAVRPLDKHANASGERRRLEEPGVIPAREGELPPLLRRCLAEFADSGRPWPYLAHRDEEIEP